MDYQKIVKEILEAIGGQENIASATHCVTRLRLNLKSKEYDQERLENVEGAKGVFFNKGQLQIIFGTGTVERVYEAFTKEIDNGKIESVPQETSGQETVPQNEHG
ncbi:MAG: PTS glucose/sucrose transporter subunit IIB [Tetragenococcus halophilus]|uniref:PTS EIIB type-1 domain-containing protein n=1 Tax=Tetragenococcus halophilus subsp. halophilus TaxID=1513897 RepID=A0A2H6CQP3_TETHA|nr:PTS transporter subunit EIIB [Tetragenococcus halophilus]MDN6182340.1 PTS glucose/sucrose transporter subunit IIB [Staphylococcus equorum]MDN6195848.1 PTS glucose/sucrose transporter subunit IIB [Atopostipes suicloacalis]MDN6270831.1 PTS glucose/sucrose transporter subunit IIB [Tetragenococcus koreensis]MDN6626635.1 PTS glucose/sucrose transporter subunit IIB [Pisciglobus halotolerans]MDN6113101.1 PTS glucose/sucrose transporter subunit IIB [Tetragenococcus halophilus]